MHLNSVQNMKDIPKVIEKVTHTKKDGITPSDMLWRRFVDGTIVCFSIFLQWVRQKDFVTEQHARH